MMKPRSPVSASSAVVRMCCSASLTACVCATAAPALYTLRRLSVLITRAATRMMMTAAKPTNRAGVRTRARLAGRSKWLSRVIVGGSLLQRKREPLFRATLGIAQPSLSHQIRQLETELQTTLLRRTKRRVDLTEAGRLFLEQARDILARADRAAVIARRSSQGETGRLRVGVGCCMNQLEVGKVVSLFNQRHRSIRVELSTMAVPAQFEALQHARLDVGLVRPPI